jgi:hypothetical protein
VATGAVRKYAVVGAVAIASITAFAAPAITSASAPPRAAVATTTTKASTTTKKATSTTTTVPGKGTYEVIAGIFITKSEAQKQLVALKKAKFKGFKIKVVAPKFAVVKWGYTTKADAKAVAKQISATSGLGKAKIKLLK